MGLAIVLHLPSLPCGVHFVDVVKRLDEHVRVMREAEAIVPFRYLTASIIVNVECAMPSQTQVFQNIPSLRSVVGRRRFCWEHYLVTDRYALAEHGVRITMARAAS